MRVSHFRSQRPLWIARRLARSDDGATTIYIALTLMVFVGSAGLAVDVASWYRMKRMMQTAVDAAAYAGALDLARQGLAATPDVSSILAAANDAAGRNGTTVSVTINHPPASGPHAGDLQSVEVVVSEPAPMFFAGAFLTTPPRVSARAVAKAVVADACVYALNPVEEGALTITGATTVDLTCGVVVNSADDDAALDQDGSSCLSATAITIAGGYEGSCITPEPEVFSPQYGDPLLALEAPAAGGCDHTDAKATGGNPNKDFDGDGDGVNEFSPGVYCGGIDLAGGVVVFAPGLYVVDGGEFRVTGSATVSNTENAAGGVTFYLTGSGSDYATVRIASGADVTLTPTRVGTYADVLFFQDPAAPAGNTNKFTGGASMDLEGALYFPSAALEFAGGSSTAGSTLLLVADTLTFSGNTYLSASYSGGPLNGMGYARMVE